MNRVRKQPRNPRRHLSVARDLDVKSSTIAEVMDWVGTDKALAQAAWDAESGQDKPRPSLLARLEARGAVHR